MPKHGATKEEVFFETIANEHRPLVMWYLARGHRVSVFNFTYALKSIPWLRNLINQDKIRRLEVYHLAGFTEQSLEATEWLYPRFSDDALIQHLAGMFGLDEAEVVFKKGLLDSVFRYLSIRSYLQKYAKGSASTLPVILVPDMFCYWDGIIQEWAKENLDPLVGIKIPRWAKTWSGTVGRNKRVIKNFVHCLANSVSLFCICMGRRWNESDREQNVAQFAHLYAIDQPFQVRFQGARKFDFLLDHASLTKMNTAFLVSRGARGEWLKATQEAGYKIVDRAQFGSSRNWLGHFRTPSRFIDLKLAMKAVLQGAWRLNAPWWLLQTAASGISTYINDAAILERVKFTNYIYTNQEGIPQLWRNALLRKRGRQSWYFALSIGGGYMYEGSGVVGGLHRIWTYQNPDHFVLPSSQLVQYQKKHRQKVQEYHEVGNIWSELAIIGPSATNQDESLTQWLNGFSNGRKLTAWFDTTFVEADESASTYREAIVWYGDILRLLEEDNALLAIIKPAKAEAYFTDPSQEWSHPLGSKLMEKWAELKQHPRIYFAGHDADPATVMALSDLTVTFCFSSCTAEALGARKKAIWYEPGNRWRETLYGREPMLVAHGYEELRALVKKLLYNLSDEEFQAYLDSKVKGLVESFLDGRGVSRFRDLLDRAAQDAHADPNPPSLSRVTR